jgi:hypothetical protein
MRFLDKKLLKLPKAAASRLCLRYLYVPIFSDPLGRDSGRDVALLAGPRRHADAADRRATQVAPPHPTPDHGGPAGRGHFLEGGRETG